MPKPAKSKKSKAKEDLMLLQISEIAPLARRNKKETVLREKFQKSHKELDEEAWIKAVKLMNGELSPYSPNRRCYSTSNKQDAEWGVGEHQKLVYEFKKAVLTRNWTNAVNLAIVIFRNFTSFNERIHLKVLIALLMSHPQVNEKLLTNTCSFLWRMETKLAITELLRCFCSMPKKIPSEFVHQSCKTQSVMVRGSRSFKSKKSHIELKYTGHIGNEPDNDMYIP